MTARPHGDRAECQRGLIGQVPKGPRDPGTGPGTKGSGAWALDQGNQAQSPGPRDPSPGPGAKGPGPRAQDQGIQAKGQRVLTLFRLQRQDSNSGCAQIGDQYAPVRLELLANPVARPYLALWVLHAETLHGLYTDSIALLLTKRYYISIKNAIE